MQILCKFPTRGRLQLFKKTLEGYLNNLSGKHDVQFIISLDRDDKEMNSPQARLYLKQIQNLNYYYGNNVSKIQACNRDIQKAVQKEWDIILLISDDMQCQVKDWDDIIVKDMKKYNKEKTKFALWYNDGKVGERLCTIQCMNKELYNYFGYLYNPIYKSEWSDNEFMEICKQLNCIKYIDKVIIKHNWCQDENGKHKKDILFFKNQKLVAQDKKTFQKRKAQNFPKETK